MGTYEARRVDLLTLAAAASLYGMAAFCNSIRDEADGPGGAGAGLGPAAMALRLQEIGLPTVMCAADPHDPPYHVWRASVEEELFLARMKGHGGEEKPFWGIAWYHSDGAVAVMMHMPQDVDLVIPAPFHDAWTGVGILISRRLPERDRSIPQVSPN